MKAVELQLQNFRNIVSEKIVFCDGINVLCGNNAHGKTSVLEAIWFASCGKSFRSSRDKEIITYDMLSAQSNLKFNAFGREQDCHIQLFQDKRRKILLNGIPKKNSEIIGNFLTVIFIPDNLNMVKEGPGERRRFLDIALCQLRPRYLSALSGYQRALEQRNALLKNIKNAKNRASENTLDVWDESLAQFGTFITELRSEYIKRLEARVTGTHSELAGNETIKLEYKTSDGSILEKLRENRKRDIEAGGTTFGPHRDDVDIYINGHLVRTYGSQGQQRSAVLSLKLAEADILKEDYGEDPVLLLDDILSELDDSRKNFVLNKINQRQVIITCCEKNDVRNFKGKGFNVSNGKITEEFL